MASNLCLARTKISSPKTALHRKHRRWGWIFAFEPAGGLSPGKGEKGKRRPTGAFSAYRVRFPAAYAGRRAACQSAARLPAGGGRTLFGAARDMASCCAPAAGGPKRAGGSAHRAARCRAQGPRQGGNPAARRLFCRKNGRAAKIRAHHKRQDALRLLQRRKRALLFVAADAVPARSGRLCGGARACAHSRKEPRPRLLPPFTVLLPAYCPTTGRANGC